MAAALADRFGADLHVVQVIVPEHPCDTEYGAAERIQTAATADDLVQHARSIAGDRGRGRVVVVDPRWLSSARRTRDTRRRHALRPDVPDKLELYRWAVQDPVTHARVLELIYARVRPGRVPRLLREDFAGTSAESVAWVALRDGREALAVDLDGPILDWARERARRLLGARSQQLRFVQADVLQVAPPAVPAAQLISALNFSIFYFLKREALRAYFAHALRALDEHGVLVANAFGGPGSMRAYVDSQTVEGRSGLPGEVAPSAFEYQWEQLAYDALTAQLDCRIHFVVPGEPAASLRDAFVYRWRLWTLPELTEIAREAGFREVQVWRHTYDPAKGAAGVFLGPVQRIEGLDTWVAYLVAIK